MNKNLYSFSFKIKQTIFYLFIGFTIFCFTSCFVDDDTCEICTEDCTEFRGQLTTEDGNPIAGVDIHLEYVSSHIFLSAVRKIATTTTDKNGFYTILAFLQDNEIEKGNNGEIGIYFNVNQVSDLIPDSYLKPITTFKQNDRVIDAFKSKVFFYQLSKRDTILTNNFIAPKKGRIQIKIDDFTPIKENDYFYVTVDYNYSFFNPQWSFRHNFDLNSIRLNEPTTNFISNFETTLNDKITLRLQKKKDNILTFKDSILTLSSTDLKVISLTY